MKTTDLSQVNDKLYHIMLYGVQLDMIVIRTHNWHWMHRLQSLCYSISKDLYHTLNWTIVIDLLSVKDFLTINHDSTRILEEALKKTPTDKTDSRYIQWMAETKVKIEKVLHKDKEVPRLLHACIRHLEVRCYMSKICKSNNINKCFNKMKLKNVNMDPYKTACMWERLAWPAPKNLTVRTG